MFAEPGGGPCLHLEEGDSADSVLLSPSPFLGRQQCPLSSPRCVQGPRTNHPWGQSVAVVCFTLQNLISVPCSPPAWQRGFSKTVSAAKPHVNTCAARSAGAHAWTADGRLVSLSLPGPGRIHWPGRHLGGHHRPLARLLCRMSLPSCSGLCDTNIPPCEIREGKGHSRHHFCLGPKHSLIPWLAAGPSWHVSIGAPPPTSFKPFFRAPR